MSTSERAGARGSRRRRRRGGLGVARGRRRLPGRRSRPGPCRPGGGPPQPGAAGYRAALTDVDVVVSAAGIENPALAAIAAEHGAAFVDITATAGYVAALERLRPPRPVLVSVGLAPGLTNLLAAAVHAAEPGPIDIALLVGAGERHGVAATAWSYGLLGKRFRDPGGRLVRNYTRPRRFDLPGRGRRRLYRADFADQHALSRDLAVPVRTYFGRLPTRDRTACRPDLDSRGVPGAAEPAPPGHRPLAGPCPGRGGTTRWAAGRGSRTPPR
jgi:hypothetical protein